jgi:uncharacterized protein YceH (UPF0502 family)
MKDRRVDVWMTISEAAAAINDSRPEGTKLLSCRQVRRRLYHLDREVRERGDRILQWFGGRVLVSADALLRALRTDPDLHRANMLELGSKLGDLDRKLHALRKKLKATASRVDRIEKRLAESVTKDRT